MDKMILRAALKRHFSGLLAVGFLVFLVAASLCTVVSVWTNAGQYQRQELERAGFGDLTAWVSGGTEWDGLTAEIAALPEIEKAEAQPIVFANYELREQESDSEGQLLSAADQERYRFFREDLGGYLADQPDIAPGEVWVSPSLVSMFGAEIGDEITFLLARNGGRLSLTIAGFYEDPFMGSSMLGMKSFLVSEADFANIQTTVEEAEIDALGRNGAMLHIFAQAGNGLTVSELDGLLNEQTGLSTYAESLHSAAAISGFMLVLQNAFCGLLLAFVAVLLAVFLIVLRHSIRGAIQQEYKDFGILESMGLSLRDLRRIQGKLYAGPILLGTAFGVLAGAFLPGAIHRGIVTTTGVLAPGTLPLAWCGLGIFLLLLLTFGSLFFSLGQLREISPLRAIREGSPEESGVKAAKNPLRLKGLAVSLAVRQLITGRRRYVSACAVAVLLTFFASLAGRMNAWLGPNGEGMMDAFNPADHHLGVQIFGDFGFDEVEKIIGESTEITDQYELAMPGVSVNGHSCTANVITEPDRYHIFSGHTCLAPNEIVITEFVAADMNLSVGDSVTVQGDSGSGEFTVSGVYQCANDMGDNIGMNREGYLSIGRDDPRIWCRHYFFVDSEIKTALSETLNEAYGSGVHVHENTWPGLFGILSAMKLLLWFLYIMAFVFIFVVTAMTAEKLLLAERKDLSVYRALGFSSSKLRRSFALRFTLVSAAGAVLGMVLAMFLADPLISMIMKLEGISNFAAHPSLWEIVFPPIFVVLLYTGFGWITSKKIRRTDLAQGLGET